LSVAAPPASNGVRSGGDLVLTGGADEQARTFVFVPSPPWAPPATAYPLVSGASFGVFACDDDFGASSNRMRVGHQTVFFGAPRDGQLATYEVGGPGVTVAVNAGYSAGPYGYPGSPDYVVRGAAGEPGEIALSMVKEDGGEIGHLDAVSIRVERGQAAPAGFHYFRAADTDGDGVADHVLADGTAPFQPDTTFVVEFSEVVQAAGWRPEHVDCTPSCAAVTAVVTESPAGTPIAGAQVTVTGSLSGTPFSYAGSTDNAGRAPTFDAEGRNCVPNGMVTLNVTDATHEPALLAVDVPAAGGIEVPVSLGCTIVKGTVIDDDQHGAPVANVLVWIKDNLGNKTAWRTNAAGEFTATCIRHGDITCSTDDAEDVPTKVPDSGGLSGIVLHVRTGGADIVGTITDCETHAPIQDATVEVVGAPTEKATTDATGHYDIPGVRPSGLTYLQASATGYLPAPASVIVPMTGPVTQDICLRHVLVIWNTGVDANGSQLPGGAPDSHWELVAAPGGTPVPQPAQVLAIPPHEYASTNNSSWIWATPDGAAPTSDWYTFQLLIDLTGFDPASVLIAGSWGVDNDAEMRLNGNAAVGTGTTLSGGLGTNYTNLNAFQIMGVFQAGVNTFDIAVKNETQGDPADNPPNLNPAGLNVSMLISGTPV
jgi:hypothetical protein